MTLTGAGPERLYLMRLQTSTVPVVNGSLVMVLGCYLVEMADGKRILIDSGLPADYTPPPGMPPPEHASNVIEQLARLGLHPGDVDTVICSHFDVDHTGYHDAFPNAELVVQRRHYEVARAGHPRYAAGRAHWDHPGLRYRLVDGDTELLPGLTLVETSGHAPGHQSVLVRLPRTGPVLLTIDAVPMRRLFAADRPAWPGDDDADALRASTRTLLDLVERERVALVVFGHDGRQWPALRIAPAYYD